MTTECPFIPLQSYSQSSRSSMSVGLQLDLKDPGRARSLSMEEHLAPIGEQLQLYTRRNLICESVDTRNPSRPDKTPNELVWEKSGLQSQRR